MSIEVIADCDECNDRFDRDGREKTYCETCYDNRVKELKELEDEIDELRSELDDVKDELMDLKRERERGSK